MWERIPAAILRDARFGGLLRMRAEYAAAASAGPMPISLILRRPLEAVVSKDEALAQTVPTDHMR
ncbi:hypothetical protein CVM73_10280 [Bradyrhizobium forestalis]|uniref:Uncharacterized protein n=1 Tax=Bradyrhizobium forestalis TaxID=1419263 RepID=A0A2M8RC93_9BRAD|nr:hypothetical protein CVM73_10280 [Bradyrhizobium forestalis]